METDKDFILNYLDIHGVDTSKDISLNNSQKNYSPRKRKKTNYFEIDLHGKTSVEAAQILKNTIAQCKVKGIKDLLIIHGKGLNSDIETGPVLKRLVEIMVENELKNLISTHYPAPLNKGGNGATIVKLK